jgi:hypothetical protein
MNQPDRNGAGVSVYSLPAADNTPQVLPGTGTIPPPPMQTPEQLREQEPDLVEYLFRAVDAAPTRIAVVELRRFEVPQKDADGNWQRDENGRLILGPLILHLHALYQRDVDEVTRRSRRVKRRDERGRMIEVPDPVEQSCRMIEMALIDEDRALLNDKRMRDRLQAGDLPGVISKLLFAGETLRTANMVRQISGIPLELEDSDTDLLKNSSDAGEER